MTNSDKIIEYLAAKQVTVNEITEYLGISRQAVHRLLNELVAGNQLIKSGRPPKVFYSVAQKHTGNISHKPSGDIIDTKAKELIDKNFSYITPSGQMLTAWHGFAQWCAERGQDPVKMSEIYKKTVSNYNRHRTNGLIDGTYKMKTTFKDIALEKVFYSDFYSIEIFGKTKLGQMLLYAKTSQDRTLMNEMIDNIKPDVLSIIKKFNVDGVGFIPPTVKREYQLMRQLRKRLNLDIREVTLVKIKTPIIVAQKTLNKLEDRITNARETIIVDENESYNNILLIDDAVGSGATLNETAKKIRERGICKDKILGYAITGSAKGFEIISEV